MCVNTAKSFFPFFPPMFVMHVRIYIYIYALLFPVEVQGQILSVGSLYYVGLGD